MTPEFLLWFLVGIVGFTVMILVVGSALEALCEYLDNWKHRRKRG